MHITADDSTHPDFHELAAPELYAVNLCRDLTTGSLGVYTIRYKRSRYYCSSFATDDPMLINRSFGLVPTVRCVAS